MKKTDGMLFLLKYFPSITVDTSVVKDERSFSELLRTKTLSPSQFWRVRCANIIGSELALPMGTFYDNNAVRAFIRSVNSSHPEYSFLLHRIDNDYYYPFFCGTLSVSTDGQESEIVIDLQQVNKLLIDSMDSGIRPRDWASSISLRYSFLSPFPKHLNTSDSISTEIIKNQLMQIFHIGCDIHSIYNNSGIYTTSYTRFNICYSGKIVLNDHRSAESFI